MLLNDKRKCTPYSTNESQMSSKAVGEEIEEALAVCGEITD